MSTDELAFLDEIYAENFEKDYQEWIDLMEAEYAEGILD